MRVRLRRDRDFTMSPYPLSQMIVASEAALAVMADTGRRSSGSVFKGYSLRAGTMPGLDGSELHTLIRILIHFNMKSYVERDDERITLSGGNRDAIKL